MGQSRVLTVRRIILIPRKWARTVLVNLTRLSGRVSKVSRNLGQDVDMQVNNPGQIQADEDRAAAPNPDSENTLSNDASLQNVAWNQCDNSQGRDPVPVKDLVILLSDIDHRASRFPGRLPKFEWSEEAFRAFVNRLEFLEGGAALEEDCKHSIFQ